MSTLVNLDYIKNDRFSEHEFRRTDLWEANFLTFHQSKHYSSSGLQEGGLDFLKENLPSVGTSCLDWIRATLEIFETEYISYLGLESRAISYKKESVRQSD